MSMKELGLRCPHCKQEKSLRIICRVWLDVDDDGMHDAGGHEWDDYSECRCPSCDWEGEVHEARKG